MTAIRVLPCSPVIVFVAGLACTAGVEAIQPTVGFEQAPGRLMISVEGRHVATYMYQDKEITRPYFANVRGPEDIQITRNHPPIEGQDPTDHASFHPGIWLALSDISGSDYWRNRAQVVHECFAAVPEGGHGQGSFTVSNHYLAEEDQQKVVCRELCRYTFAVRPFGYLLISDSTFFNVESAFSFGDEEEMGFSVRVATPIRVLAGGTMRDAAGRVNEPEIWGKASEWCDYSGQIKGKYAGAMLMPDPANFRPSWFHARDYGNLLANPFGRKAFGKGPESKVVVATGEHFQLRFGVLLHVTSTAEQFDHSAAYEDFLKVVKRLPRAVEMPSK